MTLEEALAEWRSKKRHMGCRSAAQWLCKRVPGFRTETLDRYTEDGEYFSHTVCTDGVIRIDLAPYADQPS